MNCKGWPLQRGELKKKGCHRNSQKWKAPARGRRDAGASDNIHIPQTNDVSFFLSLREYFRLMSKLFPLATKKHWQQRKIIFKTSLFKRIARSEIKLKEDEMAKMKAAAGEYSSVMVKK